LAAAPIIRSAEANDIIHIRANGGIEGTVNIQRDGNVYTFTDNIYAPVAVEKDDVLIDGAGYSLQGTGIGVGILLTGRTNVTVKNVEISDFFYGIYLNSSLNNNLSNNSIQGNFYGIHLAASINNTIVYCNITENGSSGVWLRSSSNNKIKENRITRNGQSGIWLSCSSDNNRVSDNVVEENDYGIRIDDYSNNLLRNNDIINNVCNFAVFGSLLTEFIQDIDESNTVDGKPIYYWINRQDETVPFDAGYVALVNCSGITVKNLNLSNNGQGLLLVSTAESSITENNIMSNIHGIYICGSTNNTVIGNNITKNLANGIYLYYSKNNIFFHNNFLSNSIQVYFVGKLSNSWNSESKGNYWSNYEEKYSNVAELDSLGIWNTPYILDENNQDNHPLVNKIPEFPLCIFLPLFIISTLLILICKKRLSKAISN
jgi:parallel beta-helix repeat protein